MERSNQWCVSIKLVVLALLVMQTAVAQDYPSKPINIVVPYAAGGATDMVIRLVQSRMIPILGQAITVENRTGAGGLIGTEVVAKAAPDGYTLLGTFDSFAAVPYLYSNVNHDPIKDFAPISLLIRAPQVLVVNPGLGLKNVAEFLQLARSKGTALAFSTAGPGSSSRLTMELFKSMAKIDTTLVSYNGGGPALNAVLGGHVAGFMASIGTAFSNVKVGKLVALAVSSKKRAPLLANVPTLAETFPGYEAQSWVGLQAPAATPQAIVRRLNAAAVKVLAAPDTKQILESQGMEVVASTPEVYAEWVHEQMQTWGPIIQSLHIKLN